MRDLLSGILARFQSSNRQQRLIFLLAVILVVFVARYGIGWFVDYREEVKADIRLTAQRLASANRLLETAPQTERQLERLRKRYRSTVVKLVPGDTPTLAAAELQDLVSSLAAKNNVRVQTTQVLKDEAVGSFRQVSLRVTASGTTRQLAGLLSMLEFGDLRVRIPYFELTRRGASSRRRRNKNVSRTASVTFQISGIIAGSAKLPEGMELAAVRPAQGASARKTGPAVEKVAEKEAPARGAVGAAAKRPPPPASAAKNPGDADRRKRERAQQAARNKTGGASLAPSAAWLGRNKGTRDRSADPAESFPSLVGGVRKPVDPKASGKPDGSGPAAKPGAAAPGDGLRVSSQ